MEKAEDMKAGFVQWGHPAEWIDRAYEIALRKTCSELLEKKSEKKGEEIFCDLHHLLFSSVTCHKISFLENTDGIL